MSNCPFPHDSPCAGNAIGQCCATVPGAMQCWQPQCAICKTLVHIMGHNVPQVLSSDSTNSDDSPDRLALKLQEGKVSSPGTCHYLTRPAACPLTAGQQALRPSGCKWPRQACLAWRLEVCAAAALPQSAAAAHRPRRLGISTTCPNPPQPQLAQPCPPAPVSFNVDIAANGHQMA
jgi:hypothetical protein